MFTPNNGCFARCCGVWQTTSLMKGVSSTRVCLSHLAVQSHRMGFFSEPDGYELQKRAVVQLKDATNAFDSVVSESELETVLEAVDDLGIELAQLVVRQRNDSYCAHGANVGHPTNQIVVVDADLSDLFQKVHLLVR